MLNVPERKQEKHYFLCIWEHQWVIKGRKVMLNSRVLKEKRCKLQKNKWVGRAPNKSLWCHNQRHQTGGLAQHEPWSSLWVLKWTPAVMLVQRPADYFPESLEDSVWHWTFPGFWEALTKCAKYRYLPITFTFMHPGPKFLIWFWAKGQKDVFLT